MIPAFAVVEVESAYFRVPRLWLPVFLLWLPVVLVSPLLLLVLLGVCVAGRISFWRAVGALWWVLCGLRGTHVHVSTQGKRVLVRIL